jgi:hypothetical protein
MADSISARSAGEESGAKLAKLRALGWAVAAHNDYRQNGFGYTFWLLTHECGRWVKGEGPTDAYALGECILQIERYSMNDRPIGPYAIRTDEHGVLTLCFDSHDRARDFWRWCEKASLPLTERATARKTESRTTGET